ncbi:MAG: hypothetical protein M5U26_17175 [Planctomycetota bacterium]|nr:hypothetical protein [Planctomycetota bacterium]
MRVQSFTSRTLVLLAALLLAGCTVDTQIATTIEADGSGRREIEVTLQDAERSKEGELYPAKRFHVPAAPEWTVEADEPARFRAVAKLKPGQPIPPGYACEVKALKRVAGCTAALKVRDHFISTSYTYEEVYRDTVQPEEFEQTLLGEYANFREALLKDAEREFGATHDLEPVKRYLEKDLQKLVADSAERLPKSGVIATLGSVAFRLALGGFPIKNVNQLMASDPREVVRVLIRHCLNRAQLKPDRQLPRDDAAIKRLIEQLAGGSVDEQEHARKALVELGPLALRAVQKAAEAATEQSGAATRLEETHKTIADALEKRMQGLVESLGKGIEERNLKPAEDARPQREAALARMLGAHVEANFAPIEHIYLVRLKLPGELASVGPLGQKLQDGSLRWNFSALDFFLKDMTCTARSRVWNEERLAALGAALRGKGQTLSVRQRETLDDALAKLEEAPLQALVAALAKAAESASRKPLEDLAAGPDPAAGAALDVLKAVPAE